MKWLIRYFFKTLRLVLSPIILLLNKLTTPRGITRDPEQQQQIDAATRQLALYQFRSCPFCIKVRRAARRLSLNIEQRDALHDPTHRTALLEGGGEVKVPCLRITEHDGQVRWLYESNEIIAYLQSRFAA
ncbi:glutaredoxin family protein [Thiohalophilus thiocyanatoxydans]|uniref:Glutaredoxin n=1 Tax=Thiohalophilus thiocyanatoxydans TaxID=381308 RepID=A0A4R8INS7_9GAMM|nr:glutathione S-transferase N-terminal domain-containing protein [Thiohalophilus thiocyanatoxydans]TDY02536.1 glutaredoxin [Thiohalophilus thiocyanatoxydans]